MGIKCYQRKEMHFKCCAIYTRSAPNTTETNKITQIKRFKKIAKDFYSSMKHSQQLAPHEALPEAPYKA